MKGMVETIKSALSRSSEIKLALARDAVFLGAWEKAGALLKSIAAGGGTIYICGNGGSACDAMHFTEELVARYKGDRPGIKAAHWIDGSTMTCWGNDKDFASVFARCAETFCTPQDVLVAISTSGNSANICAAAEKARGKGSKVIGLLGRDGGKMKSLSDIAVIVPVPETERIQELHITAIHAWCELFEL